MSLIQHKNGVESEAVGQAFLQKIHGWPAHLWKKTSFNTHEGIHRKGGTPYRGNFAGMVLIGIQKMKYLLRTNLILVGH